MDDSQALMRLLDRLADVRQASASGTRPTPRADTAYEPELERPALGAVAVYRGGWRSVQARTGRLLQRQLRQRRAALVDPLIRGTFALLNEFRTAVESRADPHRLGMLLHAVRQDAMSTFDAAAKLRPETPQFSADRARCLSDLEELLRGLCGQNPPDGRDLRHAMDALIVQLLRLTGR